MDGIAVHEEHTEVNLPPTSYSDVDPQKQVLSRDENFYRDTGDTVILVKQTLFTVISASMTIFARGLKLITK
jgi:hypothetical protein